MTSLLALILVFAQVATPTGNVNLSNFELPKSPPMILTIDSHYRWWVELSNGKRVRFYKLNRKERKMRERIIGKVIYNIGIGPTR